MERVHKQALVSIRFRKIYLLLVLWSAFLIIKILKDEDLNDKTKKFEMGRNEKIKTKSNQHKTDKK